MDLPIKNPSPPTTPPPPLSKPRRRRRLCKLAALCCLTTFLILFVVILTLALTLFKPKDPTMSLSSITLTGLSPAVDLPTLSISFNLTLHLLISVHNPNRASFAHYPGTTDVFYRGGLVGTAVVAEGNIPSRGTADVNVDFTLMSGNFTSNMGKLVNDVLAGEVAFESSSRIPGRIKILGFIKKHAVAIADCRVVIGISDLKVRQQDCSQKTKL